MVGLFGGCTPGAPPASSPELTPAAASGPVSASSGVYTMEQADRGQAIFTRVCSVCHGNRDFTGAMFQMTWMADPLANLFQHISTAMPQNNPGSLEPEEYAAVVAYMLRINGRPAGDQELPTDVERLKQIRW